MSSRSANEKKFDSWENLDHGGRLYKRRVSGRFGWYALYFKETNESEVTMKFWQEVFDSEGVIREIHHKFPVDTGHQKA